VKHAFLQQQDWDMFVQETNSPAFQQLSQEMKQKTALHNKPHKTAEKVIVVKGKSGRRSEGPIRQTREGGSEWEPIKILLEGDEGSNKTNTASNTRLRLTTQIGQVHVATGVLLNLGTNFQPHRLENAAEHQTSNPLTNTG
jgi:hypothetical protein